MRLPGEYAITAEKLGVQSGVLEPDDDSGQRFDLEGNILDEYDPGTKDGPDSKKARRMLARGKAGVSMPEAQMLIKRGNQQRKLLMAYARCGSISKAWAQAEVSAPNHYKWLKEDPSYREVFQEAQDQVGDMLEDVAIGRAVDGIERPVFYQGEVCGYVREYSDGLLKFLLKGAKPHKYQDRIDLTSRGHSLNIIIDGEALVLGEPKELAAAMELAAGDTEAYVDGEYVGEEDGGSEDIDDSDT